MWVYVGGLAGNQIQAVAVLKIVMLVYMTFPLVSIFTGPSWQRTGDIDAFMERLKYFFASIPYDLNDQTERHYHVVFYLIFRLLGQYIESEVKSAEGRSDAMVRTPEYLYVFEFKLNGTTEQALAQIDDKEYLLQYKAEAPGVGSVDGSGSRKLYKVGVAFDQESRNIGRWIAREGS